MIIVRSPLRITFGGGGTDLLSYSTQHEGFCISASISKYSYVGINRSFREGINLKYSEYEFAYSVSDINHPIFREAMKWAEFTTPQVEIFSVADVPSSGAGLGNSGAFTVALLKTISSYKNIPMSNADIAELACDININQLKKTQGKQDEYASSIGGINCFEFSKDGSVSYYPLNMEFDKMKELEENLLLFYTNKTHNTEDILRYQDSKTNTNNEDMIDNLHKTKEVGLLAKKYLEKGHLAYFGELLNLQWYLKEHRMPEHNEYLEKMHYDFIKSGAIGAKLIGSGMGGFFMIYTEEKAPVRDYAKKMNMEEMRFEFDFEGCKRMI